MIELRLIGATLLAGVLVSSPALAADPYPALVVTFEQVKLDPGRLEMKLPRVTTRRSRDIRTVILLLHLARDGTVVRAKVEQSSGAPHVDERALLTMREARFLPYEVDGQPQEVSLILPVHLPADDVRRGW